MSATREVPERMERDVRSVFSSSRLRCTKQRVDIYEALRSTKCHPTAEQLHRMVDEKRLGVSLATVYNTLEALCEAGLARRIPTPSGVARYDADVSSHMHAVIDDGSVVDLPMDLCRAILDSLPADLKDRLESRLGANVRHVNIQFADGSAEAR